MDVNEWPRIVREHTPLVWRTICRLLTDQADARDCFQETFISAWEVALREPVKNWPALLQHLATARALNQLRRRRRHFRHVVNSPDLAEIQSAGNGPLAQAQATELMAQLRQALAELPVRQSEAYCLRHLNELTYEQIAEQLGMTVSSVGVNLHRATQRLRAVLSPALIDQR